MSHVIKNDSLNLVWLIDWYGLVVVWLDGQVLVFDNLARFLGKWEKYALVAFFMLPFHTIFKVAYHLCYFAFYPLVVCLCTYSSFSPFTQGAKQSKALERFSG